MRPGEDEAVIYGRDFSLVYHRAFSLHALASVRGIRKLLQPIRASGGLVLELGCGSGLLAKELVADGHRVIATDRSASMLELARGYITGQVELRQLTLPGDPLPEADAIVSVGHMLNYLPDEQAICDALVAIARAVRPGGLFALDIADVRYGRSHLEAPNGGRVGTDWAVVTRYSMPSPSRLVRDITTFLPDGDGRWRRADERHVHVLFDVVAVPAMLAAEGVEVAIASGFGRESLPEGLCVLIGRRGGCP